MNRIRNGDHSIEPIFAPLFERFAGELFADDTAALIALVNAVQSVTLTTDAAQQRLGYFTAVSHFKRDDYEAAINQFNKLLDSPNLDPMIKARSLNARSVVFRVTGRLEEALAGYEASLKAWQSLDNEAL